MERISAPLVVRKPVLTTIANAMPSSSSTFCGRRARMTFVPLKRKCLATSGWTDGALKSRYLNASSVNGDFDTGTDSPCLWSEFPTVRSKGWEHQPVSMLSLTIQSPDSRRQSQGTSFREGSENSKTSPGTNSWEGTDLPKHHVRYNIGVYSHKPFLSQGISFVGVVPRARTYKSHFLAHGHHTQRETSL